VIDERVAIVTGAARGIGAATARELGQAGYQVVAVDACLGDESHQLPGVNYPLGTEADLREVERYGKPLHSSFKVQWNVLVASMLPWRRQP
jgi:NAD(P)-dependent dehydrogenase (short-subunit alcohol dehydrogenase family)